MDERKTEADCNCVYVQISLAQDMYGVQEGHSVILFLLGGVF